MSKSNSNPAMVYNTCAFNFLQSSLGVLVFSLSLVQSSWGLGFRFVDMLYSFVFILTIWSTFNSLKVCHL